MTPLAEESADDLRQHQKPVLGEWLKLGLQIAMQLVAIAYVIATIQTDVKWLTKEIESLKALTAGMQRLTVEGESREKRLNKLEGAIENLKK